MMDEAREAPIPYGRQWIDEEDILAVVEVLRSDRVTQGPKVEQFEKALAQCCDVKCAVAVNSGTSALHLAALVAGIANGDEVIASPITFVASANCIVYCGARPVFADIDRETYNISPDKIEAKITARTKAIIPVHFAGQSCDMVAIRSVVKKAEERYGHKIAVIEDACHALGSRYKRGLVGSCAYSDMAVMSFHPVKHITTAEGGAVLTNDSATYHKARMLRSHGLVSDPANFTNKEMAYRRDASGGKASANPWYYEQIVLGYNYRITDIQCGLGLSQLKKLDRFRARRREIVNAYNQAFAGLMHVKVPSESADCDSNFHVYVLLIDFDEIGMDRAVFMSKLSQKGIQTQVHYIPVYLQPYYKKQFGTRLGDCPNAEWYYARCLSIPLYPAMSDHDVERVVTEIVRLVKV